MGGAVGLLNVTRASFELDSAKETPSLTRELQRSRCVFPRGEDGQPTGLTLRHIAESVRGLFRALRSEVTVRGRIRAYQPKYSPCGRDFLRGVGWASIRQWFPVPHEVALRSIRSVTAAAMRAARRSLSSIVDFSVAVRNSSNFDVSFFR